MSKRGIKYTHRKSYRNGHIVMCLALCAIDANRTAANRIDISCVLFCVLLNNAGDEVTPSDQAVKLFCSEAVSVV